MRELWVGVYGIKALRVYLLLLGGEEQINGGHRTRSRAECGPGGNKPMEG